MVLHITRHGPALALCGLIVAGCAVLPRAGPDDRVIASGAAATLAYSHEEQPTLQYAAIDITSHTIPFVSQDRQSASLASFGVGHSAAPELRVGVGDVVQVTVFESQGGGLFVPDDAGSARTGNFVTLPTQRVDRRGFITVPYAGQVRALNRSLRDIEANIVSRILALAIEPQVTVSLIERNSSSVTVAGAVEQPGRFELTDAGNRVLDVIAQAGGLADESFESSVTLTRQGASATISHAALLRSPQENIFVAPGDTVTVNSNQRHFLAFGATGQTTEFTFDRAQMSLNAAVASVGGLLDRRADPSQVFIFRHETRQALEHMGTDLSAFSGDLQTVPTVYRMSFRRPDAYFIAGEFMMRDDDVLYVSNADSVELNKFLDLVTSITGAAGITSGDVSATGNNIEVIFN